MSDANEVPESEQRPGISHEWGCTFNPCKCGMTVSELPTLYRIEGDPRLYGTPYDLIRWGGLVPVTEPLLTREKAANDEQVQRMVWNHIRDTQGLSDLLTREEAANDPEVRRNILGRQHGYGQIALENDVSGYLHIVVIDNVKAGVYYLVEVTDDDLAL